jgi:hypothetical protein
MNCEQASLLFEQALAQPDGRERRRVMQHLSTCESCRHAFRAVAYLRAERGQPVPEPSPEAADEALRAALRQAQSGRRRAGSFWGGVGVGALAAGLAALAVVFVLQGGFAPRGGVAPAEVTIALEQPRSLSIAIDAPAALSDAEIHVNLRGAVDLLGFAGQRDVRWTTSLERGINELKLPVQATGVEGGQVRVVVRHGSRQKSFIVDVHVAAEEERSAASNV